MSQAIAQSATQLTVSNAEWDDTMFFSIARKCSVQAANGMTRENKILDWNKLVSKVCAVYRDHHCAMFEKGERLPAEIFGMVQDAVAKVIAENMNCVTAQNVVSMRRSAIHKSADMKFVEKVQLVGENPMTLKEQHLFAGIALREAKEKLVKLQNKPTPNLEAEAKQAVVISKLETTLAHIEQVLAAKTT